MDINSLYAKLEDLYESPEVCFSDEGIKISMSLAPWGCSMTFRSEIARVPKAMIDVVNASEKMFYFALDGNTLIAKTGLFVETKPTKSSLKLLIDCGIARFKSVELLLNAKEN